MWIAGIVKFTIQMHDQTVFIAYYFSDQVNAHLRNLLSQLHTTRFHLSVNFLLYFRDGVAKVNEQTCEQAFLPRIQTRL
jgi:hypothetical protein